MRSHLCLLRGLESGREFVTGRGQDNAAPGSPARRGRGTWVYDGLREEVVCPQDSGVLLRRDTELPLGESGP